MIFGDPYVFALQLDVVKSWNAPGDIWRNGVFTVYVDGEKVFNCLDVAELRTTVNFYLKLPLSSIVFSDAVLDFVELFNHVDDYYTGDGEFLDGSTCSLTCTVMEDNGCYMYYQSHVAGDKFFWSLDRGATVKGALLPGGVLRQVIDQLSRVDLVI
ncbi:Imm42 family immunity protein [Pseudomonas alliivorans]|uniref:Imm42 family immunity protein n=1 Tax=Pseudomonas alliivorans TaxID=2810613 RepID=UPI002090B043|nr:Imm42 family immunity protein [Pseudomonas alliivorans]MCO5366247.1 immunity 42 family protein [Pseudomonas alliivorans]MCQ9470343.1 immunity 42 family protein [Pseudomonas alliivorans]